jgi:transposase
MDLSSFTARIRAVEGHGGRNATDPRLLLALWMFATADGVGSARRLEALCQRDIGYPWLCGGVGVNYHLLADFRTAYPTELDGLLTDHVAALVHHGLIGLKRVAQDGMRVRASAGAGSFRRGETRAACHQQVAAQVAARKDQPDEPPGSAARRSRAARARHLRERDARLTAARVVAAEWEAKRAARVRAHPSEAAGDTPAAAGKKAGRGSTTDPEARRMKMPDGGYRPGYNVHAATATDGGIIVGVAVTDQVPPPSYKQGLTSGTRMDSIQAIS